MTAALNHRQRIQAAIAGDPVDRPPVSFWGHFYHRESTARDLAEATLEWWREYEWDFVKLNPRASLFGEIWGLTMRYPGIPDEKPTRVEFPIKDVGDWAVVEQSNSRAAPLAEQLEAIRLIRAELPDDVPLVQTVFSPLSIAADLTDTPEVVLEHLRKDEHTVMRAVEAITQTFRSYVRDVLRAGADGIFYATVDWATTDIVTPDEYSRFARPSDLAVLDAAREAHFNLVHVCRSNNLLRELADYPAHAFSWDATDPTNPNLQQALEWIRGAVVGGIDRAQALQDSTPDAALSQLRNGFEQTQGQRWIVAPGCSIPPKTPSANLAAICDALNQEARQQT